MTEEGGNAARDPKRLSPPSFELPSDDDSDDYEVWTVRLPTSLNVGELQGVELDMNNTASLATFQADNVEYGMTNGDAAENEQFRLLLRDGAFMQPHTRPFDRHVNVTVATGEMVDTELAPRIETAPTPADTIRRSYSHVPQASGMKRRWMPPGGGSVATIPTASGSTVKDKTDGRINGLKDDERGSSAAAASSAKRNDETPRASKRAKHEDVHINGDHSSSKKKSKKKKHKKEKKSSKKKKRVKES